MSAALCLQIKRQSFQTLFEVQLNDSSPVLVMLMYPERRCCDDKRKSCVDFVYASNVCQVFRFLCDDRLVGSKGTFVLDPFKNRKSVSVFRPGFI